jgi:predicted nucleic acid-binding protein
LSVAELIPPTDKSLVFVDSNVFLYAIDEADPKKHRAAQHWRTELWKARRGRVSFQVLGEFYVNAVRKRSTAREEARAEVRDLLAWNPVVADAAVMERGWKLQDRYQLSYLGCDDRSSGTSRVLPLSSHRGSASRTDVG